MGNILSAFEYCFPTGIKKILKYSNLKRTERKLLFYLTYASSIGITASAINTLRRKEWFITPLRENKTKTMFTLSILYLYYFLQYPSYRTKRDHFVVWSILSLLLAVPICVTDGNLQLAGIATLKTVLLAFILSSSSLVYPWNTTPQYAFVICPIGVLLGTFINIFISYPFTGNLSWEKSISNLASIMIFFGLLMDEFCIIQECSQQEYRYTINCFVMTTPMSIYTFMVMYCYMNFS